MLVVLIEPRLAFAAQEAAAVATTQSRSLVELLVNIGVLGVAAVVLVILWKGDVIRPGSLARLGDRARPVATTPWPMLLLVAFFIYMVSALAGACAAEFVPAGVSKKGVSILALLATYACSIAASIVVWRFLEGSSERRTSAPSLWRTFRSVGFGLLALLPLAFGVSVLALIVVRLITHETPNPIAHETLRDFVEHAYELSAWGAVAMAVVGAPIAEEYLFRVFIQGALVRLTHHRWKAIVLTATIFAAIHLGSGIKAEDSAALATIFLVGVVCGVAMERTGRPLVPILMHAGFNAVNVALALVLH